MEPAVPSLTYLRGPQLWTPEKPSGEGGRVLPRALPRVVEWRRDEAITLRQAAASHPASASSHRAGSGIEGPYRGRLAQFSRTSGSAAELGFPLPRLQASHASSPTCAGMLKRTAMRRVCSEQPGGRGPTTRRDSRPLEWAATENDPNPAAAREGEEKTTANNREHRSRFQLILSIL